MPHVRDTAPKFVKDVWSFARDHSQLAQPSSHLAQCVLVDHADLAHSKLVLWEFQSAGLAGVRERPPMGAEAGRPVDFAEQPQRNLVEAPHAPSDTPVIVDCVDGHGARVRWQFVQHQSSGSSAMKQLAQAEIKPQSFLSPSEPSLAFFKHEQSSDSGSETHEVARPAWRRSGDEGSNV
jgi:hypothetical protein